MNTLSTAPVGTLFTCQYTSSNPKHADEPSYPTAGIVVTEGYDNSKRWKALLGGWNHAPNEVYGFPTLPSSIADYTDIQTYSTDTFPYPELLI